MKGFMLMASVAVVFFAIWFIGQMSSLGKLFFFLCLVAVIGFVVWFAWFKKQERWDVENWRH